MELEKMKSLWDDMSENNVKMNNPLNLNIKNMSHLKYNEESKIFKTAEITGLIIAYIFAGIILFNFNLLDNWYLLICGIILVSYLLLMPFYTLVGIRRMKKVDLVKLNYKEVLEHFYSVKSRLKQAEKISLWASPLLFISASAIITKIFLHMDLFTYQFKLPILILITISFVGAFLFNVWVFQKRDSQLRSVKQLLEEGNY